MLARMALAAHLKRESRWESKMPGADKRHPNQTPIGQLGKGVAFNSPIAPPNKPSRPFPNAAQSRRLKQT